MTPNIQAVLGKAEAFVEVLTRLSPDDRAAIPHGHFARDYNTLRQLALEVAPTLDQRMLGKYVEVIDAEGIEFSRANYIEIEVYARQIVHQLDQMACVPTGIISVETPEIAAVPPAKSYSVATVRKEFTQAYAPWSEQDDTYLQRRFLEGASVADMAGEFGRKPGAIQSRLRKLGLEKPIREISPTQKGSQPENPAVSNQRCE